jgi:hypothetical protein
MTPKCEILAELRRETLRLLSYIPERNEHESKRPNRGRGE